MHMNKVNESYYDNDVEIEYLLQCILNELLSQLRTYELLSASQILKVQWKTPNESQPRLQLVTNKDTKENARCGI